MTSLYKKICFAYRGNSCYFKLLNIHETKNAIVKTVALNVLKFYDFQRHTP